MKAKFCVVRVHFCKGPLAESHSSPSLPSPLPPQKKKSYKNVLNTNTPLGISALFCHHVVMFDKLLTYMSNNRKHLKNTTTFFCFQISVDWPGSNREVLWRPDQEEPGREGPQNVFVCTKVVREIKQIFIHNVLHRFIFSLF